LTIRDLRGLSDYWRQSDDFRNPLRQTIIPLAIKNTVIEVPSHGMIALPVDSCVHTAAAIGATL
jgi:hypothetical protein